MTNTPRSADEIEAEITRLRELKPNVPHYTYFGDDNHAAIDAEIAVLEGKANPFDYDDEHVSMSAQDAEAWRDGYSDAEAPSAGWAVLVK